MIFFLPKNKNRKIFIKYFWYKSFTKLHLIQPCITGWPHYIDKKMPTECHIITIKTKKNSNNKLAWTADIEENTHCLPRHCYHMATSVRLVPCKEKFHSIVSLVFVYVYAPLCLLLSSLPILCTSGYFNFFD